ncbi:hypothetical protein [Pedobacter jeongneungensis]|uniref:hypothetical protein n=1 Tax=Pedobacter jeongneungensis TaxID=947309 RepID=UPI0013B3D252|nr:hypothetical protein [Pedobacter jeongneungensis]
MKTLKVSLSILFFFISKLSSADEGCLVGTTVYPNFAGYNSVNLIPLSLGTKSFYTTSPFSTTIGTCPGWVNINSSGGTCLYGNPTLGLNLGGFQIAVCAACPTGTLVDYTFINCNLDDYSWTFGAAAGLFGIFVIRRRNKP